MKAVRYELCNMSAVRYYQYNAGVDIADVTEQMSQNYERKCVYQLKNYIRFDMKSQFI